MTAGTFGQRPGEPAPNKGRRYPAEPLTPDEVTAGWIPARRWACPPAAGCSAPLPGTPLSDDYVRGLLRRLAARTGITKRVHPHCSTAVLVTGSKVPSIWV